MNNMLEYGLVVIKTKGYEGSIGFYDDDEGDKCIVYLGSPCLSDYILCKPSELMQLKHSDKYNVSVCFIDHYDKKTKLNFPLDKIEAKE